VPYFSAAFARTDAGWIGAEVDLTEVAILDDVADIMREAAVETSGDTVVLLVEQEDEWFAVLRLDDGEDPRVFLSDSRAGLYSELAAILHEQIGDAEESDEPAGDAGLLADLGTGSERLTELGERTLPGDALSAVAESAGFAEEYERLR
jgi:putative tRNA adenosine deaminase-associated protein